MNRVFQTANTSIAKAIVWGGLLAGSFDLIFAFLYYGIRGASMLGILQSITAGLIGKSAAHEGAIATGILGFMLHFVISFSAAAIYSVASRSLTVLTQYSVAGGLS